MTIAALLLLLSAGPDETVRFSPPADGTPQLPLEIVRDLRQPPPGRDWNGHWPAGLEPSGLIRGRADDRWFWLLNDSGNEPRIFAVDRDGRDAGDRNAGPPGVLIRDAVNVDWEDFASLPDGRLVICDTGNNGNNRRDLRLIVIKEPEPSRSSVDVEAVYGVGFVDQTEFPPPVRERNFDCEAVYSVGDRLRLVTKHRGDALARVYALPALSTERLNMAEPVATVDFGMMVTGADTSSDGRRLLVLTYRSLWLFERDTPGEFFGTDEEVRVFHGDFAAGQTEAVCFADGGTAFIGEETNGTLYRVRLSDLAPVAPIAR